MSSIRLRTIIILMSFSLVGLVAFQLYWIDGVVRSNEERFRKDVIEALKTVSQKLEKQETYAMIRKTMMARQGAAGPGGGSVYFEFNDSLMLSQELNFSLNIFQSATAPMMPGDGIPSQAERPVQVGDRQQSTDMQKVSNKSKYGDHGTPGDAYEYTDPFS